MNKVVFVFLALISIGSSAAQMNLEETDVLQLTLTRIDPERIGVPWFRSKFDFTIRVSGIEDAQNNSVELRSIDWSQAVSAKYDDYARPNLVVRLQLGEIAAKIRDHLRPDPKGFQIEVEGYEKGKLLTYRLGKAAIWLSELSWLKGDVTYGHTRTFQIQNYSYLYQSGPLVSREGFWAPCYGNWPTLRCFFHPGEINIGDPRTTTSSLTFEAKIISSIRYAP